MKKRPDKVQNVSELALKLMEKGAYVIYKTREIDV